MVPAGAPHLDVHQEVTEGLISVGPGMVYSRLLRLKAGPGVALPSQQVECDLCESWEHPDSLTYTFRLREGVRWQDRPPVNGRTLTAEDVAFSLRRLLTPGTPGATLLGGLESVEASGPLTVTLRLARPDADFLGSLAHGQAKVVTPEAVAVRGHLREGPTIGTGPWILESQVGTKSVYAGNPDYFERGLPGLETLEVEVAADSEVRLATLLVGRADVTTLPLEMRERLQGREGSVRTGRFPQPGTGLLMGLKTSEPPLDRVEVRRAVFQALDPWEALREAWNGQGEVALGLPVESREWLLSEEELRGYFGDGAEAGRLLAESGVVPPVPLTLSVADFGDRYVALGEFFERQLQSAGFKPTVEILNPRVYAERVWEAGDFQAFLGPLPPVSGTNRFLSGLLHSGGVWRITGTVDPELDGLIERQSVMEEGRGEALRELQRYVLDRALLFMPATGSSLWAWRTRVQGFAPNFASSEYLHWARLRVTE